MPLGDRKDPAIAEIIRRLDVPGVRDLGIVAHHGDGHPVSSLAADDADDTARSLRGVSANGILAVAAP